MKRINLTIILSIILVMVIPFNCMAEIGATIGADLSVTGSYAIDPRTHEKYLDKFVAPTEFEYKTCGDVVVKYKVETSNGEKIGYNFFRIWTEQEYVSLYLSATEDCRSGYNIANLLMQRNKNEVRCLATDFYDGTFSCTRNNPNNNPYGNSSYALVGGNSNLSYFYDFEVVESDFPIFSSEDDAIYYMNTGIVQNALYDPTVHYSGDDLYFNDFRIIPHVSNRLDSFYFEIYYELSDYALSNIDTLNLRIDNQYTLETDILGGFIPTRDASDKSMSIPIKGKEKGFILRPKNIPSISSALTWGLSEQQVLGYELGIDFSKISVGSIGGNTVQEIVGSNLYMQFYLRCNTSEGFKQGRRNDYTYDFLANASDYSVWTPTTDSAMNGNFDYTQEGNTVSSNSYYYNEVTTNENGDTVNKYYYVDNGKKTEITENEYNNNSYNISGGDSGGGGTSSSGGNATANAVVGDIVVNVGGQGDYVNISPKDYKTFVDNVKDMLEELDTKGGLFLMLKDVYALFPPTIWVIVGGGLSAVVIVSIVKILRG